MRTVTITLESLDNNPPLVCSCDTIYLHLKPTSTEPIRTSATAPGVNLITATLTDPPVNLGDIDNDCKIEWEYVLSFDESQLLSPTAVISNCDIEVLCCEDCELKTAVKLINEIPYEHALSIDSCDIVLTNVDLGTTSSVDISTMFPDCVSVATDNTIDGDGSTGSALSVNISGDAGNDLTTGSDGGLFVEADNLAVTTDATVDGDGTVLDPLSVPISTDADNDLSLGSDSKHFIDVSAVQNNSAMADSGNYTAGSTEITHTSGDGSTHVFAEGFHTVKTATSCVDTGVRSDRVVRGVSISADELILDVVAEHHSGTTGQAASDSGLSIDISDAGTDIIYTGSVVTLNNPSLCRDQSVLIVGDNTLQVNVTDTGVWDMEVLQSLDGGAFLDAGTAQYGPYPGTTGTAWLVPSHHEDTIPAGGSLTVQRRISVSNVALPSGAATVVGYALGMRILTVTQ